MHELNQHKIAALLPQRRDVYKRQAQYLPVRRFLAMALGLAKQRCASYHIWAALPLTPDVYKRQSLPSMLCHIRLQPMPVVVSKLQGRLSTTISPLAMAPVLSLIHI